MELKDSVHKEIVHLCEIGDNYAAKGQFSKAIGAYEEALERLPLPHSDWEAGQWIFAAIGDAYFHLLQFDESMRWFFLAHNCLDGHLNAFIVLRIGQCFFEFQDHEKAKEFLMRAFLLNGVELFQEDDEKYWSSIKDMIEL
ncbi:MAG: tetratricopeptide repeat protein [Bacteroidia bacterium]